MQPAAQTLTGQPPPARGASERDFPYGPDDFRRIAALAYRDAGIAMPDSKTTLVYSRLAKRVRALGLPDFRSYCDLLESGGGEEERRKMISALTTNVTRFFREDHHFRILAQEVLPPLIDRARKGGRVRLWSAGCSTGEEAYSMAFLLLNAFPEASRANVRLLATDVDPEVLAVAREGCYPAESARALPDWAQRFLDARPPPGRIRVGDAARALTDFRQLNLVQPLPMKGPFDVIFCRNVTIYFDAPTQDRLWQAFAEVMAPGSALFIGHSERLSPRMAPRFATTGMTSYRLLPVQAGAQTRKG